MNIDGIFCEKCNKQIVKVDEKTFECPSCHARWYDNKKWTAQLKRKKND